MVELVGARTATYFPAEEATTSLTDLRPRVGGAAERVRYALQPEMRTYLFRDALSSRLDAMEGNIGVLQIFGACGGGNLDVNMAFETRYRIVRAEVVARDRLCGGVIEGAEGLDFGLLNLEARAEVRDFCVGESGAEDDFVAALANDLPAQFAELIEQLTTLSASDAGVLPMRTCGCDAECGPAEPFADPQRGPRSVCQDGFCNVRAEVDRMFVMPDGIELVFAESEDDTQFDVMDAVAEHIAGITGGAISLSCDPARAPSTPTDRALPESATVTRVTNPPDL